LFFFLSRIFIIDFGTVPQPRRAKTVLTITLSISSLQLSFLLFDVITVKKKIKSREGRHNSITGKRTEGKNFLQIILLKQGKSV